MTCFFVWKHSLYGLQDEDYVWNFETHLTLNNCDENHWGPLELWNLVDFEVSGAAFWQCKISNCEVTCVKMLAISTFYI